MVGDLLRIPLSYPALGLLPYLRGDRIVMLVLLSLLMSTLPGDLLEGFLMLVLWSAYFFEFEKVMFGFLMLVPMLLVPVGDFLALPKGDSFDFLALA